MSIQHQLWIVSPLTPAPSILLPNTRFMSGSRRSVCCSLYSNNINSHVSGSSRHMVSFFSLSLPLPSNKIYIYQKKEEIRQIMVLECHFLLHRDDLCQRKQWVPQSAKRKGVGGGNEGLGPKSEYQFRKALCFSTWISSFNLPACFLPPRLEGLIQNRTNLRTPLRLVFLKCFALYKRGDLGAKSYYCPPCHVWNWPLTFDSRECETSVKNYVMPNWLQGKTDKKQAWLS